MATPTASNPLADPPPNTGDLSRFIEDGAGFSVVSEGEGDIPIYDWDAEVETELMQEAPAND